MSIRRLVLLGTILCSFPAFALEQPLTGEPLKWTAGAGGKSTAAILSQQPLAAEVKVGGGAEGFPGLTLGASSPHDWRRFSRLACEVLLESEDPGVRSGGKNFAFCLNDHNYRHESIEGKPTRQQVLKFDVRAAAGTGAGAAAGDWQEVALDLTSLERSGVVSAQLYLYDMPYNYPHAYKVTFRNLRLIGGDPENTFFDGQSYSPKALAGAATGEAGTVKTADGLAITLGTNGGIAKLASGSTTVGDGRSQASGILIRDAKTAGPPVMAGGKVEAKGDTLRQTADLPEKQLKLEATYRGEKDRIVVDGRIESTSTDDRAITVYVALPISPGNTWEWHRDLNTATRPFETMKTVPTTESSTDTFPLAVLSDLSRKRGLALLIDQSRPVLYRLAVNPRERLLYAAFDFGLIDGKSVQGRDLRTAEFHLEIAATDPLWGLRSGVEKLYAIHPENFVDRVGHGGGWEINGAGRQGQKTDDERLAGGYRFDWSAVDIDQETWNWNDQHGVSNLLYIEPDFLQFSMGDSPAPTVVDVQRRIDKLATGDEAEWAAFLPLHYSRSHVGGRHTQGRDLRTYLAGLIESQRASLMYDRFGQPILGLGHRPGWIGDSGFGSMSPANLAPAIPGGRGQWILDKHFRYYADTLKSEGWAPLGGFGLDCFMDLPADYRRENFRYMTSPLAFDHETKQPMVPRGFGSVEWLAEVRRRFAADKSIVMANCFGPMTFVAPNLDVFGLENSQVVEPQFYRVIAGPKRPITFLPYDPPSQAMIDFHVLWGIYPGRNVPSATLKPMIPVLDALYAAKWQPVTGLRASLDSVQVERYGTKEAEAIYVAVHNPTTEEVSCELRLDGVRLGPRSKAVGVFRDDKSYVVAKSRLPVKLGRLETKVFRFDR